MMQEKFDMVFLDLKLPNMDGIETLKRLKQKSSATEVIMITGHLRNRFSGGVDQSSAPGIM